jgi:hypothetical protein
VPQIRLVWCCQSASGPIPQLRSVGVLQAAEGRRATKRPKIGLGVSARCVTSAIATAGSGSWQAPSPLLAPCGIRRSSWSLRLRDRGAGAPRREHQSAAVPSRAMALNRATEVADRVAERRRTVALARHSRDAEDLSIAQVVQRLGRVSGDDQGLFLRPDGREAGAVKARYVAVCRECGAYTKPCSGKGDACKACHPVRSSGTGRPTGARRDARAGRWRVLRRVRRVQGRAVVCFRWASRSRRLGTERISVPNPR